ncbi:T9SS type A sorting domain-containing protein [Portibacter lacus]|uniref:Pectate lyase domain-containing protein n=1 Tax=Portibacter lacus TaxID=1099794 RepID=A0AA37SMT3_9BACT|nr:T9SS type A sorting domain-containing protein [Portibacter lacus]GLR15468.1 hypothetical protein GCM10007940_00830 [Portibacter lacus]
MYIKKLTFLGLFLISISGAIAQSGPVGWAAANGGTTGGQGGEVVTPTSRNEFAAFCASIDPLIIKIEDTLELILYERISVNANKTIIGATTNAMLRYGGLEINGRNVIIRNLIISDSYDGDWDGKTNSTDAITIQSENVWVDHCLLATSADGLLDVRSSSASNIGNYVTVSYTRFMDHNKVSLIGSSDNSTQDRDHLKVTFHHCWFDGTVDKGLNQRLPRIRYGDIHLYNNYFEDVASYCILARLESDVVVERNYFRNSLNPHSLDDFGLGVKDPELVAIDNIYEYSSSDQKTNGTAFNPSDFYDYSVDSTRLIPAIVMNEAGPFNKSTNTDPIAVEDRYLLEVGDHSFDMDVIENDTDEDGDQLFLAGIKNKPEGVILIRFNKLRYIGGFDPLTPDTVVYQLVDTHGGYSEGLLIVDFAELSSVNTKLIKDEIDIYPNPAQNKFTIEFDNNDLQVENISLIDVNGSQVHFSAHESGQNKINIQTKNLPAGIYFVSIPTSKGIMIKKIQITK